MADFVQFNPDTGAVIRKLPSLNTPDYEGKRGFLKVVPRIKGHWPQPPRYLIVEVGVLRERTAEEKAVVDAEMAAAEVAFAKNEAKQLLRADDGEGRARRAELNLIRKRIAPTETMEEFLVELEADIDSGDAEP